MTNTTGQVMGTSGVLYCSTLESLVHEATKQQDSHMECARSLNSVATHSRSSIQRREAGKKLQKHEVAYDRITAKISQWKSFIGEDVN